MELEVAFRRAGTNITTAQTTQKKTYDHKHYLEELPEGSEVLWRVQHKSSERVAKWIHSGLGHTL